MDAEVTLDRAGRLVLPKAVREELRLSPGDTLEVTVKGNEVTLRPRRAATALRKERGVWVFRTGQALSAEEAREALRQAREQRHRPNESQ